MKISPARVAAFDVLSRIETDRAFSSVLLPLYEDRLPKVDRGLCHELVMGVLRRQIYLDRAIAHFAGTKKLDTAVRIALRLGTYQLLFLDKIPAYSAINESVNLVQKARKSSAKGLVNAVLRKITSGRPQLDCVDDVDRISVETSHPTWLLKKWSADFGCEVSAQIAEANNSLPRVSFRLTRKGSTRAQSLVEKYTPSSVVEGAFVSDSIDED